MPPAKKPVKKRRKPDEVKMRLSVDKNAEHGRRLLRLHYHPRASKVARSAPFSINRLFSEALEHFGKKTSPGVFLQEFKGKKFEVEKLKVSGAAHYACYKVTVGKKVLFVKQQKRNYNGTSFFPGLDLAEPQAKALILAEKHMAGVENIPEGVEVEIAKFHFAWTRGEDSFLVTDFYDGGIGRFENMPNSARRAFCEVNLELRQKGLADIKEKNILWFPGKTPETGKLVFFDLRPWAISDSPF